MATIPRQTLAELFNLDGKVALVTGGAMGIGEGIARRLAEAGAAVMIADLNLEAAQIVATQIRATEEQAEAIKVDMTSMADIGHMTRATVQTFGRIDILVNNAGIFPFTPALFVTEKLWDRVLDTNLKGLFFAAQAVAQEMIRELHGGTIINIASIDALHPTGNLAHYDASKAGVVMLTKSLALELGVHAITVNAIAPGAIQTPGVSGAAPGEMLQQITARIPLRRMGVPEDIANVALFLASGASAYMTGSLVVVDGGFLLA